MASSSSSSSSSSFLLCFIFFACFFPSNGDVSSEIQQACNATRRVEACKASLSSAGSDLPNPPTPLDIILLAINASAKNLRIAQSKAQTIILTAGGNLNLTLAGKNCLEVLSLSEYRIGLSVEGMPRGRTKDVRFWLGAAMHYQYDCWSALKYANTTQRVNETMAFMDNLTQLTSDALSMIFAYDLHGNETFRWGPPQTERDGFWESNSGPATGSFSGFGFPANLTADATVCSEWDAAGCGYRTIQEAVNAAPDGRDGRRFVIRIRAGVYNETVRVPIDKEGLVFLGEGMGKTVITGNLNVAQMVGVSTYNSATVGVAGDRFMARDITFENTAGPDAHQAVAFRSTSDLSLLENCEFLGHQDTLYVNTLRQYYKGCRIEGTVDFIFGDSAAIFEDCLILIRPRQLNPEAGSTNTITAHGRIDPAQPTGLVFKNCILNGTEEFLDFYKKKPKSYKNYLGRPWKEFSRTVFIDCIMEYIINPQGWAAWDGDFALSTLYYGEFASTGAGANVSTRVPWSSQIPVEHLGSYSIQNFIQGDEWLPSKI